MAAGRTRSAGLGLLIAGTLTLAACGGSDDASTGTQAATTGGGSPAFCDDWAAVSDEIIFDLDSVDFDGASDRFTQAADALKRVDPPSEIAGDWQTLITFYEQFGAAFDQDASTEAVGDALVELEGNAGDLAAASEHIAKYATEHC